MLLLITGVLLTQNRPESGPTVEEDEPLVLLATGPEQLAPGAETATQCVGAKV